MTGLLARIRGWLACRRGAHDYRRLRKAEGAQATIAARRICDRCGHLRAVKARARKEKHNEN